MKTSTMIFAAVVVAMLAIPGTLGSDYSDREAAYVGGSVDAPPPSAAMPGCDTEVGSPAGGVLFCNVPTDLTTSLEIEDAVWKDSGFLVLGTFTCLESVAPDEYAIIAEGLPSVDFGVPSHCVTHPDDDSGTTRLGVFPDATAGDFSMPATSGTVSLKFY